MTILSLYIGDINRLFSTFVSGNLHSNVSLPSSSQPPQICRSQMPQWRSTRAKSEILEFMLL